MSEIFKPLKRPLTQDQLAVRTHSQFKKELREARGREASDQEKPAISQTQQTDTKRI